MRTSRLVILFGTLAFPISTFAASSEPVSLSEAIRSLQNAPQEIKVILGNEELTLHQKFSSVSNVLKTKHDTVKSSINNIR